MFTDKIEMGWGAWLPDTLYQKIQVFYIGIPYTLIEHLITLPGRTLIFRVAIYMT